MKAQHIVWITTVMAIIATLTAGCADEKSQTRTLYPYDPNGSSVTPIILSNSQPASVVIGQPDFTLALAFGGGSLGPQGMALPYGNSAVINGKLYIVDQSNSSTNRILGYNTIPTTNFVDADFVLGQPDFVTTGTGNGISQLNTPTGLSAWGNTLAVADAINNRVLLWNPPPTTTAAPATTVVGQVSFGVSTSNCTQTTDQRDEAVSIEGGKLVVAEYLNNRVLIFNSIPTTNGQAADLVLGQADFVSCSPNRGVGVAANGLGNLRGVWSDGNMVVVSEYANNRVLIWHTFPTANGQAADVVIGQPDFTSSSPSLSQTGMSAPVGVYSNGLQLFVADGNNCRVLVYNSIPTTNGAPADVVLGEPNFTTNSCLSTQTGLGVVSGVTLSGNQLIVTDGHNRVLIYQGQ